MYASFCGEATFRFIFGTFRSDNIARFVLRIIRNGETTLRLAKILSIVGKIKFC